MGISTSLRNYRQTEKHWNFTKKNGVKFCCMLMLGFVNLFIVHSQFFPTSAPKSRTNTAKVIQNIATESSVDICPSVPSSNTIIQKPDSKYKPFSQFQIIIITHNRPTSLQRCLQSARQGLYDGDSIVLSIWIDRFSKTGAVNFDVVNIAKNFTWTHGDKYVHIWDKHVGLYGQWIDTYIPRSLDDRAIILEDDLELSPYYYRWLKGAFEAYSHRNDIFGYTLQRGTLRADQRGFSGKKFMIDPSETAFLYLLLGSWGYSPEPRVWKKFREWFHIKNCQPDFKPYVNGLLPTQWFRGQEQKKSMWTMWHIRYADEHKLYTVYANLINRTLAANWREPGLHFSSRSKQIGKKDFEILDRNPFEKIEDFRFPQRPILVNWNGTYQSRNGKMLG